jgi:transaldolase/glucose-6-phosphate isomerase
MPTDVARMGTFKLGTYESAIHDRLGKWADEDMGRRIWEKDFTVWSTKDQPEIEDRLGWLDLPERMSAEIGPIRVFADEVKDRGFTHVVLLGMGGSSLAPEVYRATFGSAPEYPEMTVLDSTHPDRIAAVESAIDLKATLFVVSSKSGTTIESLSLMRYFYDRVSRVCDTPGLHFVAITDPGSPLEDLARKMRFRMVFSARPDVGGRYSALSHFGLVPAALMGVDIGILVSRARSMAVTCAIAAPEDDNPGLVLGATLGELALAGRDKLTFVTSPSLSSFPLWLEQLIAESTGKDGKGIIPVAGEELGEPGIYADDRVFVYIATAGEADNTVFESLDALASAGHPVIQFILRGREDLAIEMFRWEMAVASAGAILGIHPFNQPDVELAKQLARDIVAGKAKAGAAGGVKAESGADLEGALRKLLGNAGAGTYVAIQAFVAADAGTEKKLDTLRLALRDRMKLAVTTGFGPRYLHSTGQLHKGGPDKGIFIHLVDSPAKDLDVPEADHTFAKLIAAQAGGDFQALEKKRRRVLSIDLGKDASKGLGNLETAVKKAI